MLKKILSYILPLALIPIVVFAAGKAVVSSKNMTATPIAGINSSGEMVALKTDNDGLLQVSGGVTDFLSLTDSPNSYTGQGTKVVRVNAGETALEFATVSGTGTVTSIDVSGGTTGLTTSGGPVTASGTITLTGTLNVANGGTGATSASAARGNLGAAASGSNADITSLSLNNTGLQIRDTNASHFLSIVPGSDLTANRVFTLTTGDTPRTLDLSAADTTISIAGAALIDDANASDQRTTLGLGTIATQAANNVSISGGSITGITDLAVADGGTGASTLTSNGILLGNGTSAISATAAMTNGQIIAGSSSAAPVVIPPLAHGGTFNIALQNATTTNSNDSIKITCGAAACSSTNPGFVGLMDTTTAGRIATLKITADVTINLTGAHWGAGTLGDIADTILNVYAINDSGTLKWGVGLIGNARKINSTLSSATATDIDLPEEFLVNSTLGAGTLPMAQIGYVSSLTFDDTGGAAEDLWAVPSTTYDLVVGQSSDGLQRLWNTSFGGFSANPTVTQTTWTQHGMWITAELIKNANGTSNATTYTITLPIKASSTYQGIASEVVNNGSGVSGAALARTTTLSTTCNLYQNFNLGAWTNVNAKNASVKVTYNAYTGI